MSEKRRNSSLHPRPARTEDAHTHYRHHQNLNHCPENSAPEQALNKGGARNKAEEDENEDRREDDRPVQEVNRQTYGVRGARHVRQVFCDIHVNAHHRRYNIIIRVMAMVPTSPPTTARPNCGFMSWYLYATCFTGTTKVTAGIDIQIDPDRSNVAIKERRQTFLVSHR